jgi:hypothetical protein
MLEQELFKKAMAKQPTANPGHLTVSQIPVRLSMRDFIFPV